MNIRAKFKCENFIQHAGYQGAQGQRNYQFNAVGADEVPENKRFHKYTPSGSLNICVDNPDVTFEPGKSYYIDFSEAK